MELPAHCSNGIPTAKCSQSKALNDLQKPQNTEFSIATSQQSKEAFSLRFCSQRNQAAHYDFCFSLVDFTAHISVFFSLICFCVL